MMIHLQSKMYLLFNLSRTVKETIVLIMGHQRITKQFTSTLLSDEVDNDSMLYYEQ